MQKDQLVQRPVSTGTWYFGGTARRTSKRRKQEWQKDDESREIKGNRRQNPTIWDVGGRGRVFE